MTVVEHLVHSSSLRFDLPFDVMEASLLLAFDRDVADREFILTVVNKDIENGIDSAIEGLSFSTALKRSFIYVPKLAEGVEFRTKRFKIPFSCDQIYVELLPWSDRSVDVRKVLRGLAVELPTAELGLPTGWGRLVIPGKDVRLESP